MSLRRLLLMLGLVISGAAHTYGEGDDDAPAQPGKITVERWRFGVGLTARGGALRSVVATVTVPMDWHDQRVRIVEEELSPGVKVSYQPVEDLGRQMVVRVANLPVGVESRAVVTLEIKRLYRSAPTETDGFVLPSPKRLDRKLALFLLPSPQIESNHEDIRAAAERFSHEKKAWDRVKAIYDWVQVRIQYEDNRGETVLSALEALRAGKGDCDEMSALFIAVCRASGVPARMVRVPGHVYSEFYLLDSEGRGHWFPCQSAGTPSFGAMPDLRPILQRGDNVWMFGPDPRNKKKVRYRFFPENVTGVPVGTGGSVERRPICELEK